ncbi:conserved hypothetical protein [Histoplasma capsulatum var. duboisii H88]|uniref:Uncharacterized protein n=1 Tax=Ajellomyces capsulatus (strain H88) TaxID=544711 RepID=F0US30_AJEC8|nr:conserved hypothetical protein [Histoplasma capsulatum var. duboisii H88]QSS50715.1 hypothetical protein I7I53_11510 [Histoplasma capsulatum var. duboisii H88]
MALKRKASFTTITSPRPHSSSIYLNRDQTSPTPMPFLGTATITVDEPPRHLHSRTRKRFRNDRPDEQTIYDKTLQWLFSAQRQPQSTAEPTLGTSTAEALKQQQQQQPPPLDPNQHTLQRFFQPVRTSRNDTQSNIHSHGFKNGMSPATSHMPNNRVPIPSHAPAEGSGGNMSMDMDMDMGMGMDTDLGACAGVRGFVPVHVSMDGEPGQVHVQRQQHEQERRWVGGIGWM